MRPILTLVIMEKLKIASRISYFKEIAAFSSPRARTIIYCFRKIFNLFFGILGKLILPAVLLQFSAANKSTKNGTEMGINQ